MKISERVLGIAMIGLLAAAGLLAIYATVWSMFESNMVGSVAFALATGAIGWFAWVFSDPLHERVIRLGEQLFRLSISNSIWLAIAVGMIIRVVWYVLAPSDLFVEHAQYDYLARQIVAGEPYAVVVDYGNVSVYSKAYLTPGMPILLAATITIIGSAVHAPFILNLVLYFITALLILRISRVIDRPASASVAIFVISFWPGYFTLIGFPENDLVLVPLLLIVADAYLRSRRVVISVAWPLIFGIAAGAAALTQPTFLFLPLAFLVSDAAIGSLTLATSARRFALVLLGAALVVAPWSARNYAALGGFVPLSSNGGAVLLKSNNPAATGGAPQSRADPVHAYLRIDSTDELERDRIAYERGKEWIKAHPIDFFRLAVRKQLLFFGGDDSGISRSMTPLNGLREALPYRVLLVTANAFWILMAVLWTLSAILQVKRLISSAQSMDGYLQFLAFTGITLAALVASHSIMESRNEYHVPFVGLLAITVAALFTTPETLDAPAAVSAA